ncbi:hypothetical protein EWM64_g1276 [Hericium alpestre]|uniref:DUF6535 domain-containing protein n=1 Tax=Hericium alpestre TaxID=135208 RepID=A0A4Z0A7M9_9AGAM|nr:hypothetical protein EWM64_g1276 [Hericium alpestre]
MLILISSMCLIKGHDRPGSQTGNSAKIWSIYLSHAEKYDKALVESWKGDMDGILIFSGLFSAVVSAFVVDSYKFLQEDYNAATVQALVTISAQLANASTHVPAVSPNLVSQDPKGNGTMIAINVLWFLSLVFSLSCALGATLVQQWSRTYIQGTEERFIPHEKARMRTYLLEGVERFGVTAMVQAIPVMLHVALFLFFAGLVVFPLSIALDSLHRRSPLEQQPMGAFMQMLFNAPVAGELSIYQCIIVATNKSLPWDKVITIRDPQAVDGPFYTIDPSLKAMARRAIQEGQPALNAFFMSNPRLESLKMYNLDPKLRLLSNFNRAPSKPVLHTSWDVLRARMARAVTLVHAKINSESTITMFNQGTPSPILTSSPLSEALQLRVSPRTMLQAHF